MALHLPDFVRVTIDGQDRTAYVISYSRHSTLCSFSDVFTLEMSFEIPQIPDPYDEIVIRELYDGENEKVIGGYVIDVIQDYDRGAYVLNGQDRTLLLDDYFIHTQHFANNESVAYWMNWYASLVGLTVQYDSSVSQFIVEEGTPMGMITASEGIALLERLAAVYIKYDAEIDKLRVFRINTSESVINITNDSTTAFKRETGTEKTRNVVKVHGGYRFNIFDGTSTQVFATARTDIPELIVDKTSVIVNPLIRRTTIAQIVATRILGLVDDLDDIVIVDTAGFYPFVDVGEHGSINVGRGDFTYNGDRQLTSIQTTVDTNGAITIFTFGEKCPRVSIIPPLSIVYATATTGGVLISYDGGDSFEPYNAGFVSASESDVGSGIDGRNIAANKYSQLMSVADNKLYKRAGKYGSWSEITNLGDPSDDEGLYSPSYTDLRLVKVEKEAGYYGKFHVLAKSTANPRWWVYWTDNFGTSWDSMQLYVPGSGVPIGTPSGLPIALINGSGITHEELQTASALSGAVRWSVAARDIEGSLNSNVTVALQTSVDDWVPVRQDWASDYYFYDLGSGLLNGHPQVFVCSGAPIGQEIIWDQSYIKGTNDCVALNSQGCGSLWAPPKQDLVDGIRKICYLISQNHTDGKYHIWRTINGGETWSDIHSSIDKYNSLAFNQGFSYLPPTIIFRENSLESSNIAEFAILHYSNPAIGAGVQCGSETPCGSTCYYYTQDQLDMLENTITVDIWTDDITGSCSHSSADYDFSMSTAGKVGFLPFGTSKGAQIGDLSYVSVAREETAIGIDCESPQGMQGTNISKFYRLVMDWGDNEVTVQPLFETDEWIPVSEGGQGNKGNYRTTQINGSLSVLTDVYNPYPQGPVAEEPYHATVRWYWGSGEIESQEYDPDETGSILYQRHFYEGLQDTHFLGFNTYIGSNAVGYQAGFPYANDEHGIVWNPQGYWIQPNANVQLELPSGYVPQPRAAYNKLESQRYGAEITSYETHPEYGVYVFTGAGEFYGFQWADIPASGWWWIGGTPTHSNLGTAKAQVAVRSFPDLIAQPTPPPNVSGYAPCHLFHTNDTWTKHRILWSGLYFASGLSLFGDSYSHNLVGAHYSALSGYASWGGLVTLTRLDTTSGKLAIAGSPNGIPYTIAGPTTTRLGGKIANYLDEFSTAMGVSYIETAPASGTIFAFAGDIHWNAGYPPASGNWFTVSGIGEPQNDIIGLDYPDNPRVLVSSPNPANGSGIPGVGVMVINVASGAAQEYRYGTLFSPEVVSGLRITDLEAQRILG